jgi:hypothetical protein
MRGKSYLFCTSPSPSAPCSTKQSLKILDTAALVLVVVTRSWTPVTIIRNRGDSLQVADHGKIRKSKQLKCELSQVIGVDINPSLQTDVVPENLYLQVDDLNRRLALAPWQ